MTNVVLVVDMLRGFCEEGNPLYTGESARRIIPNVRRLLDRRADVNLVTTIYLQNSLPLSFHDIFVVIRSDKCSFFGCYRKCEK